MDPQIVLALASGVALAAAAGLRAFLPLLAVGLAARFAGLPLHAGFEWLASDPALIALGVATLLEILADKIPVVDHALDAIGTVVRPAAAALSSYAVLAGWGAPWGALVALALGAGALAVHGAKAKTRLGSTVLSAGHANPLLSAGEDGVSLLLVLAAVLVPLVALGLVVLVVGLVVRFRSRRRGTPARAA